MNRRISYFTSALLLSGVLAVVLRNFDPSSPKQSLQALVCAPEAAVPADSPSLRPAASAPAETISSPNAPSATTPSRQVRMTATSIREVRVRAVRDGQDYGWVQLPRGTRVELVRNDGDTLVIRYDQVTLRIPRTAAETGMVVPVPRQPRSANGLAGL